MGRLDASTLIPDQRVRAWARALAKTEFRTFERTRTRFLKKASLKRLRACIASARRLHYLCDDIYGTIPKRAARRLAELQPLLARCEAAFAAKATFDSLFDRVARTQAKAYRKDLRSRAQDACTSLATALAALNFE